MSLTIIIDRTEAGRFRAEVAGPPGFAIEHADLPGLVEELKQTLDRIAIMPDGGLLLSGVRMGVDTGEGVARAEVERAALRNEDLDELIDRYPVPAQWGTEPEWSDDL